MTIRYPDPLQPGDRIGVTAPSSGVSDKHWPRLEFCLEFLRQRGYDIVVGDCLHGSRYVSAPVTERAAELTAMLTDPRIRVVIPPWGGELAIDLLPHLDWVTIGAANPTWMVGFSDISTLITPMTLLTGIATLHGNNLMDTPFKVPAPLLSWLDVVTIQPGASFTQGAAAEYRARAFDNFETDPTVTTYALDSRGTWTRLDGERSVTVSGRLVGGCIETLSNLSGTPYADLSGFAAQNAAEGLLVYLEAAEESAYDIGRRLHGMKLAGWFTDANAILIGRTAAPGHPDLSQHQAVLDALGDLGVPIIADIECGHVPPQLPIVNGAAGRLVYSPEIKTITQTLG